MAGDGWGVVGEFSRGPFNLSLFIFCSPLNINLVEREREREKERWGNGGEIIKV